MMPVNKEAVRVGEKTAYCRRSASRELDVLVISASHLNRRIQTSAIFKAGF